MVLLIVGLEQMPTNQVHARGAKRALSTRRITLDSQMGMRRAGIGAKRELIGIGEVERSDKRGQTLSSLRRNLMLFHQIFGHRFSRRLESNWHRRQMMAVPVDSGTGSGMQADSPDSPSPGVSSLQQARHGQY